ncbi:MAG TPA: carbon-nitrogen hydrolase family protein [Candidatus Fimenecus excrementigallinarum]|uniref:Carbon-nitrogen hydrolase family protein n=1 Tax=Candidatus Fimenecus excrementigallinarum TaxID=2840816 RepID=A0A9D1IHP5_9FIRM|nr:carbon-nitrogen hydrolase family protein [Candidatus Fimenecus excrementigallinarum]
MDELRIALLQLLPMHTQKENLQKGLAACEKAKALGADIALFPEMWNTGYSIPQDAAALRAAAIPADSGFVRAFSEAARELQMAIAVTFLEAFDPAPRNTVCLFDRTGREVLRYAKVHTCAFDLERVLAPGDGFSVVGLETAGGTVKLGAMICFDREFPESARLLMLGGAEVILAPNACPMEINRLSALRTRAYENMLAVATCNYPAGQPDCNGHSTVFDGVAWLPDEPASRDMCILEAPEQEGIYVARIDLAALRAYREKEVMGNAYRRVPAYGALLDPRVREPFVRTKRFG